MCMAINPSFYWLLELNLGFNWLLTLDIEPDIVIVINSTYETRDRKLRVKT